MTLAAWLDSRVPPPPPELAARIRAMAVNDTGSALGGERSERAVADRLLDAAEAAMRALLRDGCLTRESAIELLAVDALVTYAFEAAADEPERIEERATRTLGRIAALGEPHQA